MSLLMPWRRAQLVATAMGFTPADVPQSEADALIRFYNATAGAGWTASTNWLVDPVVNNWYGVTVAGGHVTVLNLNTNNLVGEGLSSLAPLTSVTSLLLNNNTSLTGDLADLAVLTLLTVLNFYVAGVSGSVTDLAVLTLLTVLQLSASSVTGGNINAQVAMQDCQVWTLGWNAATVDAFLLGMYTNRASYTYATPALNIGGTNDAPSGVYQYAAVPSTGQEYRYALVNDDDAEGFNKWAITATA